MSCCSKVVSASTAAAIASAQPAGHRPDPDLPTVYPNGDLAANVSASPTPPAPATARRGRPRAGVQRRAGRPGRQRGSGEGHQRPAHPVARRTTPAADTRGEHPDHDPGRHPVGGRAGLRAGGQEDRRQQLHRGHHAAQHGEDPGHGPGARLQPLHPANLADTTNIPVANVFDPGSTAKVITAAAAMEHGGQTPMSAYTVPDSIDHRRLRASMTRSTTRPSGGPSPGSSRTPATWAWSRWSSTSARRCSTSTSGTSASGSPAGRACPRESNGILYPTDPQLVGR